MGYNQGKQPRGSQAVTIETNMAEAGEAFGNIAGTLAKKYYSEEMRKPRLEKRANRAESKGKAKADKLRARSERLFSTTTSDNVVKGPIGGEINGNGETQVQASMRKEQYDKTSMPTNMAKNNSPTPTSDNVIPGGAELAEQVMGSFSKPNFIKTNFTKTDSTGPVNPANNDLSQFAPKRGSAPSAQKTNNKDTYKGISTLKPAPVKVEQITENDPEMVPYSSTDAMPGSMNSFSKANRMEAADNTMEASELNQGAFDKIMGLNMTAPDAFAKGMKRKARYTK
jgi:hypothetical protein